jgi:hypothetical protein
MIAVKVTPIRAFADKIADFIKTRKVLQKDFDDFNTQKLGLLFRELEA